MCRPFVSGKPEYLIIEKVNCAYFTGMIAYVQEIAARTEQYWCPIKHARRMAAIHSRYIRFFEFGDAEGYRRDLEKVQRDFEDLPREGQAGPDKQ